MSLNWKEIDLILEEIQPVGSHIQHVKQPDFSSLLFELYRPKERFTIFICLAQAKTRIHTITQSIERTVKVQRFVQFLRSRILGGRIVEAYQVGHERIVKITVRRAEEYSILWVRLWGGAGNIIATDSHGTILDTFYRRPNRHEVSGGFFHPEQDPTILPPQKGDHNRFTVRDIPGSESFNRKIEKEYQSKEEQEKRERVKEELYRYIAQKESSLRSGLDTLQKRFQEYEQFDKYKLYGDLISAGLHEIEKGQKWYETHDFTTEDNDEIEIELQPDLTPVENAERYYKKYKKAKSGLEALSGEIESYERSLRRLEQEKKTVEQTTDVNSLSRLLQEYKNRQKQRAKTEKEDRELVGLEFESQGFTILVGRNARENDDLLRNHVRGNDVWLHTRDYPGGYVFIKTVSGKSVPLEVLLDAGNLAVFYSKARTAGEADLYYTQVKYLRRAKQGKKGLVLPTQEKNLSITLDTARIRRLHGN